MTSGPLTSLTLRIEARRRLWYLPVLLGLFLACVLSDRVTVPNWAVRLMYRLEAYDPARPSRRMPILRSRRSWLTRWQIRGQIRALERIYVNQAAAVDTRYWALEQMCVLQDDDLADYVRMLRHAR